jgi:hypothetical protein
MTHQSKIMVALPISCQKRHHAPCTMHHVPCTNKQTSDILLNVNMPNGTSIQSSYISFLLRSALPQHARQVHIFPGLVHNSLVSVGQLCDSGCKITFTRERVEVTKDGQFVMLGLRDPQSRLCRVNLK